MNDKLLLGIDIGSTAVKVIAMTEQGVIRASASAFYTTFSPRPGWMEQDPEDWGRAAFQAVRQCLEQVENAEISALSFSGHMSAPVLLDADGVPLLPSILIADTRSQEQTRFLREFYLEQCVEMTGNEPVDAFAIPKLLWIKAQQPGVLERTRCILFPKDYVRFLFTGERGTDRTDAGNSLVYNPAAEDWDRHFIAELGLDPAVFPELHAPHGRFGTVSAAAERATGIPAGTPVITGAADMACSQLGSGAGEEGTLALTLSTSAQIVMSVPGISPAMAGRVTFHPSAILNSTYAMGSVFTGGLGVDWGYRLLTGKGTMQPADYEELAKWSAQMEQIPPGSNGLLFLPFLLGSGTPYFDPHDRASWLGLSTGQSPALLLHSIMEGISYNIRENMDQFEQGGLEVRKVMIGGGGSRNPVWCRMISEVLGKEASILSNRDAAAVGASILAGVGIGVYASAKKAALSMVSTSAPIPYSETRHENYNRLYARYLKLYPALNEYYCEE
ncbi:FGGY family carbohydrate kinase [Paenibacillus sp. FSL K6-1096]|uniref:xylulokinase n=1 Tax=Paenibacillus sp. FSL K6-1096 TaxID=2921460 RepID=UPI0030EC637E